MSSAALNLAAFTLAEVVLAVLPPHGGTGGLRVSWIHQSHISLVAAVHDLIIVVKVVAAVEEMKDASAIQVSIGYVLPDAGAEFRVGQLELGMHEIAHHLDVTLPVVAHPALMTSEVVNSLLD